MFNSKIKVHSLGDIDRLAAQELTESEEQQSAELEQLPSQELSLLNHTFIPSQEHENDRAEVVLVSEPEAASITMGGLHPRASLYERPVNLDASKKQHLNFRKVLRSHGIKGNQLFLLASWF